MTIGPATTLRDLAFIVCTAFDRAGETVVLTGGGAATVYAPDAYQSRDLDFIFSLWSAMGSVNNGPLIELGFYLQGSSYAHGDTTYTIDFPVGPLAIGGDTITSWNTLREGQFLLHILSPTDCDRDRLAWFYFNNDFSALEQALAVGNAHAIDRELVKDWSDREGVSAKYEMFADRLQGKD